MSWLTYFSSETNVSELFYIDPKKLATSNHHLGKRMVGGEEKSTSGGISQVQGWANSQIIFPLIKLYVTFSH